jgi:hypothetical protein
VNYVAVPIEKIADFSICNFKELGASNTTEPTGEELPQDGDATVNCTSLFHSATAAYSAVLIANRFTQSTR